MYEPKPIAVFIKSQIFIHYEYLRITFSNPVRVRGLNDSYHPRLGSEKSQVRDGRNEKHLDMEYD